MTNLALPPEGFQNLYDRWLAAAVRFFQSPVVCPLGKIVESNCVKSRNTEWKFHSFAIYRRAEVSKVGICGLKLNRSGSPTAVDDNARNPRSTFLMTNTRQQRYKINVKHAWW